MIRHTAMNINVPPFNKYWALGDWKLDYDDVCLVYHNYSSDRLTCLNTLDNAMVFVAFGVIINIFIQLPNDLYHVMP